MIRLALYLYAFSLSFPYLWEVMFGFQTQLKPYRIAGIILIGLFLLAWAGGNLRVRLDRYDKTYLAILALSIPLAILWNVVEGVNIRTVPHMVVLFLSSYVPYLVIKNINLSAIRAERLLKVFMLGVCASVVLAMMLGAPMVAGRFMGLFDNPNRLALVVAAAIHVLIGQLLFGRQRRLAIGGYLTRGCAIIGLAICIIFTGSRAAIVATGLSLGVYVIPLMHRSNQARATRMLRVAAFLPIILLAIGVISSVYQAHRDDSSAIRRYEVTGESGYSGRIDIWRAAWAVTVDHYFIGVGPSQYKQYHREYMSRLDKLYSPSVANKNLVVHSDYLATLTSAGIIGFLLYLVMVVSIYRRLSARARALAQDQASLPAMALPMFVLILTFGVFHTQLYAPQYFFLMAIITLTANGFPSPTRGRDASLGRLGAPAV